MSDDLAGAAEALAQAAGEVRGFLEDQRQAGRRAEDRACGPELPRIGLFPELRPPGVYDRLGRKQPRRLTLPAILLAIPGVPERGRRVPARAVVEEREDEALIDCPCGRRPVAPRDQLEKCVGCERYYAYIADRAVVFYGEMEIPAGNA